MFLLLKYSKMIIDLQLIGFYHRFIVFQKKKKRFWGILTHLSLER